MMAALRKVLDGCKRHKVRAGIHYGAPAYAKKMIEMGFTFVTVGGDNRFLTMAGQAAVAEMRDAPRPGAAPARTEQSSLARARVPILSRRWRGRAERAARRDSLRLRSSGW
jgi:hypothetical protein